MDKNVSMELTADNVEKVFYKCFFVLEELVDGKPTSEFVEVDGIRAKLIFHKERLMSQQENVVAMVNQIADIEKGPSFLNICMRKDGVQWTDFQKTMEALVLLGKGIGILDYCLPREFWGMLPGGVPMIIKKDIATATKNEETTEKKKTEKPVEEKERNK